MITKKLIFQTVPTVYNDKNEFNNSSENFSITSTLNSFSPSNIHKQTSRADLKSINYFGSKSSLNLGKNLNQTNSTKVKPIKNYNFNSNSYNYYNTSFSNENLDKFKTNSTYDFNNQQDSFILPNNSKQPQQSFQKYAIERHISHFKPQNLDSKSIVTKMLNGNIEESLKDHSIINVKDLSSTSKHFKNDPMENNKNVNSFILLQCVYHVFILSFF